MNPSATPSGPAPAKSRALTVLAWAMIGVSGVLLPISLISQLMILAGSHGTSTSDPGGWLTVVAAPVAGFLSGIGLLRRRRWALVTARVLFIALCAASVVSLLRAPAEPYVYYSADGVKNTVTTSPQDRGLTVLVALICGAVAAALWSRRIRQEFAAVSVSPPVPVPPPVPAVPPSGSTKWRTGHLGRDSMFYEEWHDGGWQHLRISGEMLMGRAHHVIYFASPEQWQTYPEWARLRRAEIVARIKHAFPEPDYEYDDPADPHSSYAASAAIPPPVVVAAAPAPARPVRANRAALFFCLTLFAVISAVLGWLCYEGLRTGSTWLPSWQVLPLQPLRQTADPAWFRFVLSIYGTLSAGALAFVLWLTSAAIGYRGRPALLHGDDSNLR